MAIQSLVPAEGWLVDRDLLAAIDAGAALRIPTRDQHPVLRDRGAIEPDERRSLNIVQSPFTSDVLPGHAVEDLEGLVRARRR
jgi:hypothetical protein